jgi:menaquinone-dependent protoporphyrinogen IX oxidase
VERGSAIYAGSWLPAAKRFAEQHRAQLATLPLWVFSSGPLGAANPQPQDDPSTLPRRWTTFVFAITRFLWASWTLATWGLQSA